MERPQYYQYSGNETWRNQLMDRSQSNSTHLNSIQEAQKGALRAVEIVLPGIHGLQTVDEAPIEAVVRRSQETVDDKRRRN